MTTKVVLYTRVSSDERKNEGRKPADQLNVHRDYAIKYGWQIVAELSEADRGASGANHDLPQLNKALEIAETGLYHNGCQLTTHHGDKYQLEKCEVLL